MWPSRRRRREQPEGTSRSASRGSAEVMELQSAFRGGFKRADFPEVDLSNSMGRHGILRKWLHIKVLSYETCRWMDTLRLRGQDGARADLKLLRGGPRRLRNFPADCTDHQHTATDCQAV